MYDRNNNSTTWDKAVVAISYRAAIDYRVMNETALPLIYMKKIDIKNTAVAVAGHQKS